MGYDNNNIFAKIISGEIPCDKVYEDEYVLAFNDITPAAPVHILVIPKIQAISFDDFVTNSSDFITNFFLSVKQVAKQAKLNETGYRLITNHGKDGCQTVPHFHVHILGGEVIGPLRENDSKYR